MEVDNNDYRTTAPYYQDSSSDVTRTITLPTHIEFGRVRLKVNMYFRLGRVKVYFYKNGNIIHEVYYSDDDVWSCGDTQPTMSKEVDVEGGDVLKLEIDRIACDGWFCGCYTRIEKHYPFRVEAIEVRR